MQVIPPAETIHHVGRHSGNKKGRKASHECVETLTSHHWAFNEETRASRTFFRAPVFTSDVCLSGPYITKENLHYTDAHLAPQGHMW